MYVIIPSQVGQASKNLTADVVVAEMDGLTILTKLNWPSQRRPNHQVYQIAYVIVKAAISPRPGNWILERSVDGETFSPWQYFAISNEECWTKYGLQASHGNHAFQYDSEVICTSYFSRLKPLEGGEIHTFLIKGRPGANSSSDELMEFTRARYVRLRLQKLNVPTERMLSHLPDKSYHRSLFYSIKEISVGGQCICNGHAAKCRHSRNGESTCECQHNTCGGSCNECCPLFNQRPWRQGTIYSASPCEMCQCHGHATSCVYDATIDEAKLSLDIEGYNNGGGVCTNCTKHTTGINCERCETGWYRPIGVRPDAEVPCLPCQCSPIGSVGSCAPDDLGGKVAGSCECLPGFAGELCDRCAIGFHNYPNCVPCSCDFRGSKESSSCNKHCDCKSNVMGAQCDECKPGFFGLSADNPDGCSPCYCSGISSTCEDSYAYKLDKVDSLNGWLVCDLGVTRTVLPTLDIETNQLYIGNYELPGVESYFWLAPEVYRGDKVTSYGSRIQFHVSWVVMRGDTSGKPTETPDIVIIGNNGLKLGYGKSKYYNEKNESIIINLIERGWFRIEDGNDTHTDSQIQAPVSREQFLSVIGDIKHILLRATFHTDQVEGSLLLAILETGTKNGTGEVVRTVERCICPDGYSGLLCQYCSYGYARILPDSPNKHAVCTLCDCNNHAVSCDPINAVCTSCEHNTTGPKCGQCLPGFYGNAENGEIDDCKPCACPLTEASNNFSAACIANGTDDYTCTQCSKGYAGQHCEECAFGYYGNPLEIGSTCKLCDCNNGPCNQVTGQCLDCKGNTEGWRCEKCKPHHYGDPLNFDCKPCNCSSIGSKTVDSCNTVTGQCECLDNYTGRACDRCFDGFGNVTAGCKLCDCDAIGSQSELCDPQSGQCPCKPGVAGDQCNQCLPSYYGFSTDGCKSCNCDLVGSTNLTCDSFLGTCTCHPNVVGKTCDTCEVGFWGLGYTGCQQCSCDSVGSVNSTCNPVTGQCECKIGIGGQNCDRCLPDYYGFSVDGCLKCEPCNNPGFICDPDTGQCVCPVLSEGETCNVCKQNAWGFKPLKGCQPCNCDSHGSLSLQCNSTSGHCLCQEGYEGIHCNRCSPGYFGYPRCRPCNCHQPGVDTLNCQGRECDCDEHGQCPCKSNVIGKRCDECKDGTFGLSSEMPEGCIPCFCFGRTTKCIAAGLSWSQVRLLHSRTLSVEYDSNATQFPPDSQIYPVNTQEICFINLAVPGGGEMSLNSEGLNVTNNLRIIPGDLGDVQIGVSFLFDTPVYWQLPASFLGDKVLSYGGYLRFAVETEGGNTLLPPGVLSSYPLIQIQGNGKIVLEHFPALPNPSNRYEVRLHESLWHVKNNPTEKINRETLMLTLQNLQHILIRATDSVDFKKALLRDVSLDKATEAKGSVVSNAVGVELCECPHQYNSTSCQNPSIGFYRHYNKNSVGSTVIIQVIGEAAPCECNGRSNVCDIETGHCLNCSENTGGENCEYCAEGYYGDPILGPCKPCPCPYTDRNFAQSCQVFPGQETICTCKPGYTGKVCDRCSYGWFGFPQKINGSCRMCECNPHGSVSDECHELSGQCNCKLGITGRDCSVCPPRHTLSNKGCVACEDGCTDLLLDKLEDLEGTLREASITVSDGTIAAPWPRLMVFESNLTELESVAQVFSSTNRKLNLLLEDIDDVIKKKSKHALTKVKKIEKNSLNASTDAYLLRADAETELLAAKILEREIFEIVYSLKSYGKTEESEDVNTGAALSEAKLLFNQIRDFDFEPITINVINVSEGCKALLDDVEESSNHNDLDNLQKRLDTVLEKIRDLDKNVLNIMGNLEKVRHTTESNKEVALRLDEVSNEIVSIESETDETLNTTLQQMDVIENRFEEFQSNVEELKDVGEYLKNLTRQASEKEASLSNLNPLYKEVYVIPAQKHADGLLESARSYDDLFQFTRQKSDYALRASKAYQSIIDALKSAREAAVNASLAATEAFNQVLPERKEESLLEKAKAAEEESRQIKTRAELQDARVQELHAQFKAHLRAVESLRNNVKKAAKDDNSIAKQLQEVSNDEASKLEETLLRAEDIIQVANEIYDNATVISSDAAINLRPQLKKLDDEGELSLQAAEDKITDVHSVSKRVQEQLAIMQLAEAKRNEKFTLWNSTLLEKLDAVKMKITQARHIADGIRLSLTSKGERGSCIRSYQPDLLESSITNTIVLTYAISSQHRDALLFYLPSSTTSDFLAVEMVNRKIRFVWNVGGDTGEVTNAVHIQTAGDLSNDQHWYRIEAERKANVGTLYVRPQVLPFGSYLRDGSPVTGNSTGGIGRLDVSPHDRVWVGGADHKPAELRSMQPGLVGCLHNLFLDGRPIGLWDFRTQTEGCTACIEGAEEVKDEQTYRFLGDGYAVLHHDSSSAYNKYLLSVSLNFKTFDEDALLFLAVTNDTDKFVSVTLSEGRVVFRVGYGGDISLEISSNSRYNTGNWTRLEATRYFDRKKKVEKGILKIGTESRDGAPTPPPNQDAIPDLSQAQLFVGGTPPSFRTRRWPGSYLGCMSEVNVAQEGYNLLRGQFWGIQPSCSQKALTIAGFNGNGYLELASYSLEKKAAFGFVFATLQQNCLLMLSTSQGLMNRQSYYAVSLRNGQIDVRLNAGHGEVRLASTSSDYGNGQFHSVVVIKRGKKLELQVDDTTDSSATLPRGSLNIKVPGDAGGLFFGGIPPDINTTGLAVSDEPLIGTIKDAIFNNSVLAFDKPLEFEHVAIGRHGPVPVRTEASRLEVESMQISPENSANGCRKVSSYPIESGAAKFGDTPHSHVQIDFSKRNLGNIFQDNFTLEMQFRTFYPNGVLLVIPSIKNKLANFIMATLVNGRLKVIVQGKKKKKSESMSQIAVNDGLWHHMMLMKEEHIFRMQIDNNPPISFEAHKKSNIGNITYIGGLPEELLTSMKFSYFPKTETFKGCLARLILNGQFEDLVGDKYHKVGQCFPHVEKGSYFPGDAFAIYENEFDVGSLIELEIEFRTSEMNGIILSVSQPEGYPALSLQFINGKVVMTGDMGDRRPFRVELGLGSDFAVCDNKWHRIVAQFNNDEITLRLDSEGTKYWLSDNGHLTGAHTNSPLYIGGLPDHATIDTLETRENFKGCIRYVSINKIRKDWIEMEALHSILLGSCPRDNDPKL
nr:PREDICTED: laminin subunit alpha-1 [Bemisia tabaci]